MHEKGASVKMGVAPGEVKAQRWQEKKKKTVSRVKCGGAEAMDEMPVRKAGKGKQVVHPTPPEPNRGMQRGGCLGEMDHIVPEAAGETQKQHRTSPSDNWVVLASHASHLTSPQQTHHDINKCSIHRWANRKFQISRSVLKQSHSNICRNLTSGNKDTNLNKQNKHPRKQS